MLTRTWLSTPKSRPRTYKTVLNFSYWPQKPLHTMQLMYWQIGHIVTLQRFIRKKHANISTSQTDSWVRYCYVDARLESTHISSETVCLQCYPWIFKIDVKYGGVCTPPWGGVCTPFGGGGNACNWLKCAASTGVGITGVGIAGVGIAVCSPNIRGTIQLNSTNHPKRRVEKRKEAKKLIYIPDSLVNIQDVS